MPAKRSRGRNYTPAGVGKRVRVGEKAHNQVAELVKTILRGDTVKEHPPSQVLFDPTLAFRPTQLPRFFVTWLQIASTKVYFLDH
jgi:hypothetical protein